MKQVNEGLVSRYLNRRLSRPLARLLGRTPVTPNQVSVAALAVASLSCISFLRGHPLLGGVLAQASSIVDGADGDLARIKGSSSAYGGFLDAVLDRYADALIILGLAGWAAKGSGKTGPWIVGFAALAGTFGFSYTRARMKASPESTVDSRAVLLATRDVRLLLIMMGGVLGKGHGTLVAIALLTNSVVLLRLLSAYKSRCDGRPGDSD